MARTVALVQARMGSTRLPGKVLAPVAGRPVLAWVIDRVRAAPGVDETSVVTSELARDDLVARAGEEAGVRVVRGNEQDVLDRYRRGARALRADVVVRVTADCPLVDPGLVGRLLALRAGAGLAYAAVATGALPPRPALRRFPDGLDAEAFTADALETAWREATAAYDREHVTPFIKRDALRFPQAFLEADEADLGEERWTLDEPGDLAFVAAALERLPTIRGTFGYRDVLALLAREPELRALNAQVPRAQPSRT